MLLLGPLLARRGAARLAPPGGDFPARRTIGTHLDALVAMGARVIDGPGHQLEAPDGLKPTSIYLYEASVTGTETALLAAAAAPGVSEIRHAACEPHVVELCEFLCKIGVPISGIGIDDDSGRRRRRGCTAPSTGCGATTSRPAAGRSSAAITGGEIDIRGARAEDMEVVAAVLKRLSVECAMDGDVFRVSRSKPKAAGRITTGLWPGFPSDLDQPGDGARDAGRGPNPRARLAVRAAPVRARADERA